MLRESETSHSGPVSHLRRQDVLVFFLNRALSETSLTQDDFAEALAFEYTARVPAHARALQIETPATDGDYPAYARAVGRLRKRVWRYVEGGLHLPVELEEAWAFALPQPYGARCREVLARRYGFMAALSPTAEACTDGEAVGRILEKVGELTGTLSAALADGRIGPEDFDGSGNMLRSLDDAAAAVASVRARVLDVMNQASVKAVK